MVGVYDGERYRWYRSIPEFLNAELTRKNEGKWFYAHAGGLYDVRFILEYLLNNPNPFVSVEAAFSGSSAIIVKIQKGKRAWYLVDSYWLLREKLRNIGKWIGVEKGGDTNESRERCEYPEKPCTCDPIFFAPIQQLVSYNHDDCFILWKAIERFESTLLDLGGELKMTCASSAMMLFRRSFLRQTIRTHAKINEIAREAYIASRVEVFRKDCGEANYYDINSSFPHAMTFEAPGSLVKSTRHMPDPDKALYLARCRVKIPDVDIPPIPFRTSDRRVYFPVGTWEQWFSNVDIGLLLENGGSVVECSEALIFEPFDDLREYAETVYELRRKASDASVKAILKILLNSLYGKFAEGSDKHKLLVNPPFCHCPHDTGDGPEHKQDECLELLMPGVWLLSESRDIAHAHVPISLHITALARGALFNYMKATSTTYYCDTDGFACPRKDTFETTDKLGGLKLEKVIRSGHFESPKLYTLEFEDGSRMVKSKGFSRLTYAEFCQLLEHKEVRIERFQRIKEGLRHGHTGPQEFKVPKKLLNQVRPKRFFDRNGVSRPWHVSELEND